MLYDKECNAELVLLFYHRMSALDLCEQSEEKFLFSCEYKGKKWR